MSKAYDMRHQCGSLYPSLVKYVLSSKLAQKSPENCVAFVLYAFIVFNLQSNRPQIFFLEVDILLIHKNFITSLIREGIPSFLI